MALNPDGTPVYSVCVDVIQWQFDTSLEAQLAFEAHHQRNECKLIEIASKLYHGWICFTHKSGLIVEYKS
jgi:hypothetical protein